jgi:hypothetical protein
MFSVDAADVAEKIAAAAGGRRTAALIDSVAARLFPSFFGTLSPGAHVGCVMGL